MTTAILQVRMGSTRLPGKATLPIFGGRGALELMLERVSRARRLNSIIVATTVLPEDDVLVELCARLQVTCFRGHATDVLDRYYRCASLHAPGSDLVRLTGDCPLHDPQVIDTVIERFGTGDCDYLANTHPPTFPDGVDVEVFSYAALQTAWQQGSLLSEREHVTYYIYTHPQQFRIGNFNNDIDLSHLRWTLDEPRDLQLIRNVYAAFGRTDFTLGEVLGLLARQPELALLNREIGRDEGLRKSLDMDRQLGNLQ